MKLDLSKTKKLPSHPVFEGMDEKLKDPKQFKKIERKLFAVVKTDHEHKYILTYTKCKSCQEKLNKKKKLLKLIGFKDYEQYLLWRKVMDIITNERNIQLR